MKQKEENLTHPIEPFIKKNSKILILGTFPSPKSREFGFYYSHPQNRFWKVMSILFNTKTPVTIEEKKEFLSKHQIALWDVLESCTITGASDSSIKDPVPNNISAKLKDTEITHIFTTGLKAANLYKKYCYPNTKITATNLPSTSPANCAMKLDTLVDKYKIILKYL